jgi:hypothetical protein
MPTKNLVPRADGEGKLGIKGDSNLTWKEVNAVSGSFDELSNTQGNNLIAAGSGITITKTSASGSQYTIEASAQTINSIDDIADVDTSSTAPTDGQALVWNNTDSEWQPGNVTQFSSWSQDANGSIVPANNAVYDLGTAEKKVRDLYLSDNSLRFGSSLTESAPFRFGVDVDNQKFRVSTDDGNNWSNVALSTDGFATETFVNTQINDALQGLDAKESVAAATTGTLSGYTYSNNSFVEDVASGALSIDGHSLSNNSRLLVKDQANAIENGIYSVGNIDGSSAVTLTRVSDLTDADVDADDFDGAFVFVQNGTDHSGKSFVAKPTTSGNTTVGTHEMSWVTFTSSAATVLNDLSDVTYSNSTLSIDSLNVLEFEDTTTTTKLKWGSSTSNSSFFIQSRLAGQFQPEISLYKQSSGGSKIYTYVDELIMYRRANNIGTKLTMYDRTNNAVTLTPVNAATSTSDFTDHDGLLVELFSAVESGEPALMIRGKSSSTNNPPIDGPSFILENYSGDISSPATAGRTAGTIRFKTKSGYASVGVSKDTASIVSNIIDVGNNGFPAEDDVTGDLRFYISVSGSLSEALSIYGESDFTVDTDYGDALNTSFVDVVQHDGSTSGLALSGSLVTATATEINALDVHTSAPNDGQVLSYNSSSSSLVWADASGGELKPVKNVTIQQASPFYTVNITTQDFHDYSAIVFNAAGAYAFKVEMPSVSSIAADPIVGETLTFINNTTTSPGNNWLNANSGQAFIYLESGQPTGTDSQYLMPIGGKIDVTPVVNYYSTPNSTTYTDAFLINDAYTTEADVLLTVKGGIYPHDPTNTTTSGGIKLNCEQNSHSVTIKSPTHSQLANASGSYTLTLPVDDGSANQVLQTNGSGVLSWVNQSSGGIASVSEDSAPVLGGDLNVGTFKIQSTSDLIIGSTASNQTTKINYGTNLADTAILVNNSRYSSNTSDPQINLNGNIDILDRNGAKTAATRLRIASNYDATLHFATNGSSEQQGRIYFQHSSAFTGGENILRLATPLTTDDSPTLQIHTNSTSNNINGTLSFTKYSQGSGEIGEINCAIVSAGLSYKEYSKITLRNEGAASGGVDGGISFSVLTDDSMIETLKVYSSGSLDNRVNIVQHDGLTKGLELGGTLVTATADELNVLDISSQTATDGYYLTFNTSGATWTAPSSGGIGSVAEDSTPDLGGRLDLDDNFITNLGLNGNIPLEPTGTGHVLVGQNGAKTTPPEIRLYDENGTNYTGFKASPVGKISANTVYELPAADGAPGQVLETNGGGILSWTTPSSGGSATIPDVQVVTGATNATFATAGSNGDNERVYLVNNSSTAVSIKMPAVSGNTGKKFQVKRLGTANVTITVQTGEALDTVTDGTFVLSSQFSSVTLICNASGTLDGWYII